MKGPRIAPRQLDNASDLLLECASLQQWAVSEVHEIPLIWKFMEDVGGCTKTGTLFWRTEDRLLASLIINAWCHPTTDLEAKLSTMKKCVIFGSPGVGKSTLLSLLAFYFALVDKKTIVVFQKLGGMREQNSLFLLSHHQDQVVYEKKPHCPTKDAIAIYETLVDRHGGNDVWLMVDGFEYKRIPTELRSFKLLTTSELRDVYTHHWYNAFVCLHSGWTRYDLELCGRLVFGMASEEAQERIYYCGGNARSVSTRFALDTSLWMSDCMCRVDFPSRMFPGPDGDLGPEHNDDVMHTFLTALHPAAIVDRSQWDTVLETECAAGYFSHFLRARNVIRTLDWVNRAGPLYLPLAATLFEVLIHALASECALVLVHTRYNPPTANFEKIMAVSGKRVRWTTTGDSLECSVDSARMAPEDAYWFPACHDWPDIDSVIFMKIKAADGDDKRTSSSSTEDQIRIRTVYLQTTVAGFHSIKPMQLARMNAIFCPEWSEANPEANKPLYILVCPSRRECLKVVIDDASRDLEAAQRVCEVHVGYYEVQGELVAHGYNQKCYGDRAVKFSKRKPSRSGRVWP